MILNEKQQKLLHFVKECHGDQKRKYTGEPYWTHPLAVAEIVAEFMPDSIAVEVALCHDLFEDTKIMERELGLKLTDLLYSPSDIYSINRFVRQLTDEFTPKSYPRLNRTQRKAKEAERMRQIGVPAQSVKYADLIHNTESIVKHDPDFAVVYLNEKRELLNHMRAGDINLLIKCCWTYQEAVNQLKA